MKQKQGNRIPLEQQLIQIGSYRGTMLCSGILYEAWHIPTGEYEIEGQITPIQDIYIGIGKNGMTIVPGTKVETMIVCL